MAIAGTISIAPHDVFYFANAALGDLVIRGTNGGGATTQKILLGTVVGAERDATLAIAPSNVTVYAPTFALSNDSGEAFFASAGSNLGINNSSPLAVLDVNGNAIISNTLLVRDAVTFSNGLTIDKSMAVSSNLTVKCDTAISGNLVTNGAVTFGSNVSIDQNAEVRGNAVVHSNLTVLGNIDTYSINFSYSNVTVYSSETINSNLSVEGTLLADSNLKVSQQLNVFGPTTLSNATTIYGVSSTSNAAFIDSNLTVTGATSLSNATTIYGPTTLSNCMVVTSNFTVLGTFNVNSDVTNRGFLIASNAAFFSSNTYTLGAAVLSNSTDIYGVLSASNAAFMGSNLTVIGETALSNATTIYGISSTSNAAFIDSNLTVTGSTTLSNTANLYGMVSLSNAMYVTSNLTVLGSLNATTVNYMYSNVTLFSSEEIRSNLAVDGKLLVSKEMTLTSNILFSNISGNTWLSSEQSNLGLFTDHPQFTLDVNGDINFSGKIYQNGAIFSGWNSNASGNYINSNAAFKGQATESDVMLLYTTSNDLAFSFSNPNGKASIWSGYSNVGINNSNPQFTLDVNGDVNFSGKIYQNGAIFSGWNSNASGNYINSNAAFKGQATESDVMLLYTTSNDLAFSFSNPNGKASIWSGYSNVGINNSNPTSMLDVIGDVRTTGGMFAFSNFTGAGATSASNLFNSVRAPLSNGIQVPNYVAAGFGGDVITQGISWVQSALFVDTSAMAGRLALVGVAGGVHSNAMCYSGTAQIGTEFDLESLPVKHMDPYLYMPTGDAMMSNMMTSGSVMISGSAYVEGSLQVNQAHAMMLSLTKSTNTMSNTTFGAIDASIDQGIDFGGLTFGYNIESTFAYNNSNLVLNAFAGDGGFSNVHITNDCLVKNDIYANGTAFANAVQSRVMRIQGPMSDAYDIYSSAPQGQLYISDQAFPRYTAMRSNNAFVSNLALEVQGNTGLYGTVGVANDIFLGGTLYLGSNMTTVPNNIAPLLSDVVIDVQGDTVTKGFAFVQNNLLVGSNIGVGTQSPSFPLDVQANVNGISLNCSSKVTASEFSVYSDNRIKTAIVDSDTDAHLSSLMELIVREFKYVDSVDKGNGSRIGFIAQQVASVLPNCVMPVSEYIPNIMTSLPIVSHVDATHVVLSDQAALLAEGLLVKCRSGTHTVLGYVEQVHENSLVTLKVDRGLDETEELFVVGTKVDDFNVLNYEQINAIAIGAIQAQQRTILALEARIAKLEV